MKKRQISNVSISMIRYGKTQSYNIVNLQQNLIRWYFMLPLMIESPKFFHTFWNWKKIVRSKLHIFLNKRWHHLHDLGKRFCIWNNCLMLTITLKATIFGCFKDYDTCNQVKSSTKHGRSNRQFTFVCNITINNSRNSIIVELFREIIRFMIYIRLCKII